MIYSNYMKKIFSAFVVVILLAPTFAMADDGPQFNCWDPKLTLEETRTDYHPSGDSPRVALENKDRGTCKKVDVSTIVSIDPLLRKDYFLGAHFPIKYNCDEFGTCDKKTTYSESLFVTSSSTLESKTVGVEENPLQYALFDKSYFAPQLSGMYKKAGLSFSERLFSDTSINVYNKNELPLIPEFENLLSGKVKTDTPLVNELAQHYNTFWSDSQITDSAEFVINSFNYQEYGKYITAPKAELAESQYAEFEKGGVILSDSDLQIKKEFWGHWSSLTQPVVPLTSPLKSVKNYWLYTKKNGKLTLAWQKSEYGLDNGTVKTVTNADKNISAALLFSNAQGTTVSTSSVPTSTEGISAVPQTEEKVGFFARFFRFIFSWFK